jgi:hypothetical protein
VGIETMHISELDMLFFCPPLVFTRRIGDDFLLLEKYTFFLLLGIMPQRYVNILNK